MPRILAVDDEPNILELIRLYLGQEGYQVETVSTGGEALARLAAFNPDLVVLDLMLPDLDGFEVCRRIRTKSNVPIVMLTARREDTDKIVGLEIGADDYLTKPFNPRELIARIRAIFRRMQSGQKPSDNIEMGKLRIDLSGHVAYVNEIPLKLRTREFALLVALVQNAGMVLSREKLIETVWGFDYYGETRTVDVHVNHLREHLAGSGTNIETLRGVGYKMIIDEGN
ncbi:MAG: response regulator transcription factor [Dehalococcoidales bacterium]|nr:response regulator transcription factor [Dehalococcoidales bacterium]